MGTVVHEPPQIEERHEPRVTSGSGNGGWRDLVPADGDLRKVEDYSPPPASTGIWVAVAAISMTFLALTSALIVRKGGAMDWRHFALPSILYLNTALLLASSVTTRDGGSTSRLGWACCLLSGRSWLGGN